MRFENHLFKFSQTISPFLLSHDVRIAIKPTIMASFPQEDTQRFVLTPAFSFMDVDEIRTNPKADIVQIISKQFELFQKKKGRFTS